MPGRSHHFHITKKQEKRLINRICAVFAILMPLTAVPQIQILYSSQDAGSLSLAMWVLYCVGCLPFLMFGVIYKHIQLIILNTLWLIVQVIMIVGILMYR
jgi:uncharacterized protein with PQ loop repeat